MELMLGMFPQELPTVTTYLPFGGPLEMEVQESPLLESFKPTLSLDGLYQFPWLISRLWTSLGGRETEMLPPTFFIMILIPIPAKLHLMHF
jgi:hypothetical protein